MGALTELTRLLRPMTTVEVTAEVGGAAAARKGEPTSVYISKVMASNCQFLLHDMQVRWLLKFQARISRISARFPALTHPRHASKACMTRNAPPISLISSRARSSLSICVACGCLLALLT